MRPRRISCGPTSSHPWTGPSAAARCRCAATTRSARRSSRSWGSGPRPASPGTARPIPTRRRDLPVSVTRLVLVRHAQPDGTWGRDPDPGLDDLGHEQARAVADVLAPIGPLPGVVSPLRRTRETAAPLVARWEVEPVVEPGVGELAAPADAAPDHATWLRTLMAGAGADHADVMDPFRARVLGAI